MQFPESLSGNGGDHTTLFRIIGSVCLGVLGYAFRYIGKKIKELDRLKTDIEIIKCQDEGRNSFVKGISMLNERTAKVESDQENLKDRVERVEGIIDRRRLIREEKGGQD
jgi:hypothetical protein